MNILRALLLALSVATLGACSSDDDAPNDTTTADCLASQIELTETGFMDDPNGSQIFVDFDVTNTSSKDYDVASTGAAERLSMLITVQTSDGSSYETENAFPVVSVRAGATTTTKLMAKYGAGKTYASYTIALRCKP